MHVYKFYSLAALVRKIMFHHSKYNIILTFFPSGRGSESCNLIGSNRGSDFPITVTRVQCVSGKGLQL